jgi:hypothetical protein
MAVFFEICRLSTDPMIEMTLERRICSQAYGISGPSRCMNEGKEGGGISKFGICSKQEKKEFSGYGGNYAA